MTSNVFSSPVHRWMRFLSVGAIGLAVQIWTLLLLLHLGVEPVVASLLAVEAAILHNFPLHRAWTWKDRPASGLAVELRRLGRFHLEWCSPDFVDTVKSHAALCRAARSNSAGLR